MAVLSNWTEGILFSVLFATIITLTIAGFNSIYHQNYNTGLTDNSTMQSFITYQDNAEKQINTGTLMSGGILGINLQQSYDMAKGAVNIVWSFISGGFIPKLASMLNLGESAMQLAIVLQIIYFLSIIFALLYVFFKVII